VLRNRLKSSEVKGEKTETMAVGETAGVASDRTRGTLVRVCLAHHRPGRGSAL